MINEINDLLIEGQNENGQMEVEGKNPPFGIFSPELSVTVFQTRDAWDEYLDKL